VSRVWGTGNYKIPQSREEQGTEIHHQSEG
jgi:hypothetical protein